MNRKSGSRMLFDVAATLVAIYLGLVAAAWLGRGALIYPGTWLRAGETSVIPSAARWEHVPAEGEAPVHAFYLPPPPGARLPAPVTVHFHGNGEIAGDRRDLIAFYRARGHAVLLPEYRGYGGAGGRPGYAEIAADARVFLDRLLALPEIDGTRLVLHGTSLGSTFATEAAASHPPAALVLESAFTSIGALAWRRGLPGVLLGTDYDTSSRLPAIAAPVFVIHGDADRVVPHDMGETLASLSPRATFVSVPGADHVLDLADRRFAGPLAAFLDRALARR